MHKLWVNRPEALRVGGPGENTRCAPIAAGRRVGARTAFEGPKLY